MAKPKLYSEKETRQLDVKDEKAALLPEIEWRSSRVHYDQAAKPSKAYKGKGPKPENLEKRLRRAAETPFNEAWEKAQQQVTKRSRKAGRIAERKRKRRERLAYLQDMYTYLSGRLEIIAEEEAQRAMAEQRQETIDFLKSRNKRWRRFGVPETILQAEMEKVHASMIQQYMQGMPWMTVIVRRQDFIDYYERLERATNRTADEHYEETINIIIANIAEQVDRDEIMVSCEAHGKDGFVFRFLDIFNHGFLVEQDFLPCIHLFDVQGRGFRLNKIGDYELIEGQHLPPNLTPV